MRLLPPRRKGIFSSFYRHLIAIGLIAGVAFLVYSNTFSVPFQFDDRPNITQNPNVQIKVFTWDRIETSDQIYLSGEHSRLFLFYPCPQLLFWRVQCFRLSSGQLSSSMYFAGIFLYWVPHPDLQSPLAERKIWGPSPIRWRSLRA